MVRADKLIELFKRYTEFIELTTLMLNEFIEKVVVHEANKSTGERIQKVDIYLDFIGQFDAELPAEELSVEQLEEQRLYLEKKRRAREEQRMRAAQAGTGATQGNGVRRSHSPRGASRRAGGGIPLGEPT